MKEERTRTAAIVLGIGLLLVSTIVEAQWVLVARRAIGRVEQMSQASPNGGTSYDTAAVLIDAPADKVYATFVRSIRAAPNITVAKEDAAGQTVQFTNGVNTASIKVNALGDSLAHVMLSATNSGSQPAPMTTIIERVLAACKELQVECQRAQQ